MAALPAAPQPAGLAPGVIQEVKDAGLTGLAAATLADPLLDSCLPSYMDSFSAQLPAGLASPAKPPLPLPTATSSQRSAGTVSGGEVAQAACALGPAGSLKRTLSSCAEAGADSDTSSQGCSKSQRGSVAATPARRPPAQLAPSAWAAGDSGDEAADSAAGSGDDGLEFLLRACEMLDPHLEVARHARAASVPHNLHQYGGAPSAHGTPKITRQSRHGAASLEASPAVPARRPVSRRLLARSTQSDADWEAGSDYDTADADADYMPSGGVSRPARAAARSARATARSSAAAAAAPAASEPVAVPPAPRGGRWGDQPKQLITGPCMNPECEHPLESPQWRKGPPQYPILCNACGTRWLRNGTLKPLVPRRGLRYKNKPKPLKGKAAQAAAAAQAQAAQAAAAAAAAAILAAQPTAVALPPPCPSPLQHKHLGAAAQPAHSSEASQGGLASEADEAAGLLRQQAAAGQLPMPPPLQAAVPFMPALAFNPAAVFGMDPAAAAAAAAEALKNAPQMFAGVQPAAAAPLLMPWGFFPPAPQAAPAPFQAPIAAAAEQPAVGLEVAATAEQQQLQADVAMADAAPQPAAAVDAA